MPIFHQRAHFKQTFSTNEKMVAPIGYQLIIANLVPTDIGIS